MTSGRKALLSVCIFTFLLMFGVGIATPIEPLYASSLGASWTEIGLMGTSWSLTFLPLAIGVGRISDRIGRKPLLITSAVLSACAAVLYLASTNVLQIIFVRILEGASWALFWPIIEALTTELVDPREGGQAVGIVSAAYGIAFASAAFAAGSITGVFGYWQTFSTYFVLSLASITTALILLPRSRSHPALTHAEAIKGMKSSLSSPATVPVYFLGASYTFGLGTVLTLLSVFAKSLGVTLFTIGMIFGFFWVGRIVSSVGGGRLSDRYGRRPVVIAAMTGSAFGLSLIAVSDAGLMLLAAAAVLGLSIGAVFPATVAIISDNVPPSSRGLAMGMYETSCAVGFLLAASIGGLLSDLYSPRVPYMVASSVSLVAAIVYALKRSE